MKEEGRGIGRATMKEMKEGANEGGKKRNWNYYKEKEGEKFYATLEKNKYR